MTDIKKRIVLRGTLKVLGKDTLKVADIDLKTADRTLATASKGIKAGRNAVDGTHGEATEYAAAHIQWASTVASRKTGKTANYVGKSSAKKTLINIRKGELNPVTTIKKGTSGLKTAATEMKRASTALAAARRSPQAVAMIRRAQKFSLKAGTELIKAIGRAAASVAKALGNVTAALIGGAWALLLIVLIVSASALLFTGSSAPDRTAPQYPEASTIAYYTLRTKMGLNSAAACGLMANIDAESGFDVYAVGDQGTSHGICQWHLERWDRLNTYCWQHDLNPSSLEGQLAYLQWEMENYYPDVWNYLQNVEDDVFGCYDAASYVCIHFERPEDAEDKAEDRGNDAMQNFWWDYAAKGATEQGMSLALTAYGEIGNTGGQKYWVWYGRSKRVPWCAIFVSWCANESGLLYNYIPKYAGTGYGIDWFRHRGQWANGSVEPTPGMIAFFDWAPQDGGSDHTGIVFKVENGYVYTVEGNASDCVKMNHYAIGSPEIYGYGVPNFTN